MFSFIRNWFDRRTIQRSTISPSQWQQAFASLPVLHGLSDTEKQTLRELAIVFMHRKVFEGAQGFVVTQPMAMIIALQACLPILMFTLDVYDGWYSVIVYAAGFAPIRVVRDEAGVEHYEQSNLSGEAWQQGPVVLAWNDTEQAGIIDGHNLVIHEFAHKLDMQNGVANGFPPLHADMDRRAWVKAFSTGFDDFQNKCERGKHFGIDCYAASSPAEFFAVLSEVFFERPEVIQKHYADIYRLLKQYYRQDPLSRLSRV